VAKVQDDEKRRSCGDNSDSLGEATKNSFSLGGILGGLGGLVEKTWKCNNGILKIPLKR